MPIKLLSALLGTSTVLCSAASSFDDYLSKRHSFLENAAKLSVNAAWELDTKERIVDEIITQYKEIDYALDPVPVQFNFVTMKPVIDGSGLFKLLQSFPKGALLHSHDLSSLDMHFYVNATYLPGCLYNVGDRYGDIQFMSGDGFIPIDEVRISYDGGAAAFDEALYKNFTISSYEDMPDTTGDYIWDKFQPIFQRVGNVYNFLPVFRSYYRYMFSKLLADGVTRWEMRTDVTGIYDNEKTYSAADSVKIILNELDLWKAEDFVARKSFTFGIIWQGSRSGTVEQVTEKIIEAYELREQFPGIILGFDLVGHEDPGKTLLYWAPILMSLEEKILQSTNITQKLPFFFHAGESNRGNVQENLVDAIFLNTSRIGHGFGIQEFPALWPALSSGNVLIESCPISNQVLGLVVDQRNHPVGQMLRHALHNGVKRGANMSPRVAELLDYNPDLISLIRKNIMTPALAVSISNDDPGFWEIDGLVSYDWYTAVLAWDLSLSGIKQLAFDSIVYSSASTPTRAKMLSAWSVAWGNWIDSVAATR